MTLGIVSSYFLLLHSGHLYYLQSAKRHCDYLVAIVNNDVQQKMKKGCIYQAESERLAIVKAIKYVDRVYLSIDEDFSVNKTVEKLWTEYKDTFDNIVFINDGDVKRYEEVREFETCQKLGIKLELMNNPKTNSSSQIISYIAKSRMRIVLENELKAMTN